MATALQSDFPIETITAILTVLIVGLITKRIFSESEFRRRHARAKRAKSLIEGIRIWRGHALVLSGLYSNMVAIDEQVAEAGKKRILSSIRFEHEEMLKIEPLVLDGLSALQTRKSQSDSVLAAEKLFMDVCGLFLDEATNLRKPGLLQSSESLLRDVDGQFDQERASKLIDEVSRQVEENVSRACA